ncbi:hypothetical protein NYG92_05410 [Campylobacter felis]|uniref:hypothetical protein n=1 Tax=Campylobacter felis TaxID=2974565 RepID=UPI002565AF7E|nr:hypothetical protein [Campylobacter felis]MDL0110189.1 hypothetical protein [Campylobacter felis]
MMNKKEFLEYIIDNVSYLNIVEKRLLCEFIVGLNESFIKALFQRALSERAINLKSLNALYDELLNEEALRLARNSKINFKSQNDRYKYDPLELLKSYYYEKLKNNSLKKGK